MGLTRYNVHRRYRAAVLANARWTRFAKAKPVRVKHFTSMELLRAAGRQKSVMSRKLDDRYTIKDPHYLLKSISAFRKIPAKDRYRYDVQGQDTAGGNSSYVRGHWAGVGKARRRILKIRGSNLYTKGSYSKYLAGRRYRVAHPRRRFGIYRTAGRRVARPKHKRFKGTRD
jgi:hypothetical protein